MSDDIIIKCPHCFCEFEDDGVNALRDTLNIIVKKGKKENTKVSMGVDEMNQILNTLTPLKLNHVKNMTHGDLIISILNREALLYSKINNFNDEKKNNDRKIFKTQQDEIYNLKDKLDQKEKEILELKEHPETKEGKKNYKELYYGLLRDRVVEDLKYYGDVVKDMYNRIEKEIEK